MLVNKDGEKSRILGIIFECKNCKTQLIDNTGFNLVIDYEGDYSGEITGAFLVVSCPVCLEVNKFVDWDKVDNYGDFF
jgi:ribosomal protein S27E